MRNFDIETSLRDWAKDMVSRYTWLTIRFEYSCDRNCYLVSYYYSKVINDEHPFYSEAINFEDNMNELYHNDAPLFCDEERLFKLSDNAETIGKSFSFVELPVFLFSYGNIVYDDFAKSEFDNSESKDGYFVEDAIYNKAA